MSNTNTIALGDKVKDRVTGFVGIVVAQTKYLNGCVRCGVQSDKLKDGLPTDSQWFDAPQLTLVKKNVVQTGPDDTGRPMPFKPKRAPDAQR
jgi:hypothetical protein